MQIPDLARFIAADEQELTAIIRDHAEFFRLYRGGQPPWYVMVATPWYIRPAEPRRRA